MMHGSLALDLMKNQFFRQIAYWLFMLYIAYYSYILVGVMKIDSTTIKPFVHSTICMKDLYFFLADYLTGHFLEFLRDPFLTNSILTKEDEDLRT
jgi:hypothetical protein